MTVQDVTAEDYLKTSTEIFNIFVDSLFAVGHAIKKPVGKAAHETYKYIERDFRNELKGTMKNFPETVINYLFNCDKNVRMPSACNKQLGGSRRKRTRKKKKRTRRRTNYKYLGKKRLGKKRKKKKTKRKRKGKTRSQRGGCSVGGWYWKSCANNL